MRVRYQFVKNPKTTIYETPEQAYMVIDGISQFYKLQKEGRKRISGSLNCNHDCSRSKRTHRQKSIDNRQKVVRSRRQQSYNYNHNREGRAYQGNQKYGLEGPQKKCKPKQRTFSFRDINVPEQKKKINCNYLKILEEQNLCLRKQNKFLQQYIKAIESRAGNSNNTNNSNNIQKRQSKLRTSGSFEGSRSSFKGKNSENLRKQSDEEGSTFGNKMASTKGQSQWNSYHS